MEPDYSAIGEQYEGLWERPGIFLIGWFVFICVFVGLDVSMLCCSVGCRVIWFGDNF